MASQRIVLTSPWRLGLFVFLLVVGTGFGLVYAYVELFGWSVDMKDPETVRYAYMVLGGVAAVGLLGYIAVVTSSRPLDRVVRGSKAREQAIKRLGKVSDPRDVGTEEFDDEPVLAKVIERWASEVEASSVAQLDAASRREAITVLTKALAEAAPGEDVAIAPEYETPELMALAAAIGDYAQAAAPEPEAPAPTATESEWDRCREDVASAVEGLGEAEAELEAFVPSIASRAGQLAEAAQRLASTDASGAVSAEVVNAVSSAQQNAEKVTAIREALENLAEESNKLAITMALQLSRLGEAGGEMLDTAEGVRSLSTRYQRLAADLRMCEIEQASTLSRVQQLGGHGNAVDSSAARQLVQEAMGLDQNAEVLREVLGKLQDPLSTLRRLTGVVASSAAVADSAPVPSAPVAPPVPESVDAPSAPAPAVESDERIYDIAELGGRPLDGPGGGGGSVHELQEYGAVEL